MSFRPCAALIADAGLEKGTIDFIGHALALYDNDSYLSQPAIDLVDRCKVLYIALNQLNYCGSILADSGFVTMPPNRKYLQLYGESLARRLPSLFTYKSFRGGRGGIVSVALSAECAPYSG